MIVYYSRFTTTDGKEFMLGYDSESRSTSEVIVVEVSNLNPANASPLQGLFPNTPELVVKVPENKNFFAQNQRD